MDSPYHTIVPGQLDAAMLELAAAGGARWTVDASARARVEASVRAVRALVWELKYRARSRARELAGAYLAELLLAEAEEQLLELAIGLASKAMMQEIQDGRARVEPLLKEALLRFGGRQDVVVYLNPEDLAQCLTEEGQTPELANLKFQADAVVHRGQCLVETSQGAMISSYTDKLDDLADAVRTRE